MSRKSLLILLVVALVVGLAAILSRPDNNPKATAGTRAPGTKLLAGLDPSAIAAITISTPDGKVTVNRGEKDVWTVAERDGYQVDASRLSGLVSGLLDLKVLQVQQAGPSQYPRLHLVDPASTDDKISKEQKGTVVRILGQKDKSLAEIVFGKAPQSGSADPMAAMMGGGGGGPGGKFARIAGEENSIYLLDQSPFQATGNPADWVDKKFLQPGSFKKFTIAGGEGFQGWETSRDKADGTFVLKDAPAGKQLSAATNSALTSFLSYAQAADVLTKADVETLDRKGSRNVKAETFDGLMYDFTLTPLPPKEGDTSGSAYAVESKISGNYTEPAPAAGAKKPEEMSEEEKKADADNKAAARKAWDEKLAREQALAKTSFKLNSSTVEAVWKAGNEVLEDIPTPPPALEGTPPEMLTPPAEGAPASGPATATTPPISVTTEPIEVPGAGAEITAAPKEEKPQAAKGKTEGDPKKEESAP
ncbi:MAG: DUF4340 domain-containing protein [Verrucomicrobiales bacterium]